MITVHRIFIIAVVFIAISACLAVLLVYPTLKDIKAISSEMVMEKGRIVFLNEQDKALDIFKKNYESYKNNLETLPQLLPDKENPIHVIEFIETIASQVGVDTEISLSPSRESTSNNNASPVIFLNIIAKGKTHNKT